MASVSLSEAEKVYIVHGVQEDLRVDGRGCEDYRGVEVETDVVSNTSGSARVRLGHTDILVGVKAEMGTPKLEKPNEGYLEFFVDCSANATPEFEGRGGDDLGTEIANTLYRIFHNKSSVDLEALCISPREHCWVLYVDVLLLECGGNLFDAISIAVKAALFNTRIPRVRVLEDEEGSKDIELSDDPYDSIRLSVEHVPCIVTLCKVLSVSPLSAAPHPRGPSYRLPARGGRHASGGSLLLGQLAGGRDQQGGRDVREESGEGQPGPGEHLRDDGDQQAGGQGAARLPAERPAQGGEPGAQEAEDRVPGLTHMLTPVAGVPL
ncbi:exosome component 7 [Phyllostomus discolor]|uniref:Ribosomal RNA-processing protein 42 n=1 Tax=Phyllostomus discolor TaxID=89673 RepID=A0A833ZSV2_9CHIR|nr:exosome component 7 [Phyllostomus discolor]